MKSLSEKLKFYKKSGNYPKFFREVPGLDDERVNGLIIDFSDDFVLFRYAIDFDIDGFMILPLSQISKVRFNKADRFFDKAIKLENREQRVDIDPPVNLDSWNSIFKSLQKRGKNIIVECEAPESIYAFTIGPITKIGTKNVYMRYFDATGLFDDEPSAIKYSEITKVTFENRYINVFSKYTRYKKPAKSR